VKFFSQYGEIEEGPLGFDKKTGKCKGFAFFIYRSEKSSNNTLEEPMKKFDEATLTYKLSPPKNKNGTLSIPSKNGTLSTPTPAQPLEGNMWAYSSPLGGFIPVGNFGSPLFEQAFSKQC
jgi:heterogeneous nuclear ribonucleoprotein A1/A3